MYVMNKLKLPLFALIMGLGVLFLGSCQKSAPIKTKKALFVIVDGIPADVVERVPTPWVDTIRYQGGYTRATTGGELDGLSQSPTISAVCYAHLVTGTWTYKHNVWDNSLKEINYHYPSIFSYFKKAYPEKTIGIFSTWEDNRTRLMGEGKAETGSWQFDYKADGYEKDTVQYPHDKDRLYIHHIDEKVTDEAAKSIFENGPDLSFVYLQYTDDVGHMFGDSPQMDEAVQKADAQIGKLYQAIQQRMRDYDEEWVIYVMTDHGRDDTGFSHGGQSFRERTIWIISNDAAWNMYAQNFTPTLVDVLPSLLRYLDVEVPKEQRFEWDGIPMSGPVSHLIHRAQVENDTLHVGWDVFDANQEISIWVSTTNNFAEGGKDEYHLLGKAKASDGRASFSLEKLPSAFYKVALESPLHTSSKWVNIKP
jgi:hypothetical protein